MPKSPSAYKTVHGKTYFQEAIRNYVSFEALFPILVKDAQERFVDDRIDKCNLFGFRKFRSRTKCREYLHRVASENWMNIEQILAQTGYLDAEFTDLCDGFSTTRIVRGDYIRDAMSLTDAEEACISMGIIHAVEFWESKETRETIQNLWSLVNS